MSDETTTSERVGFCQDCGKPLTRETVRAVGGGAFCEPCLQARLSGAQSAAPKPASPVSPGFVAPAGSSEPHPWIAGLLGFIPGVGAMYNGQFAKGIAHVVIFAVLVSLADHVNGVFGLFVTGWIFYMAFEAFHTARARAEGLPLPNAFGLNDIGEKMGFGKGWGTVSQPKPQTPATPPAAAAAPTPAPSAEANWAGYVPPPQSAPYTAPVPPTPYSSTPYAPQPNMPMPPMPPMPARGASFPLVAIWLIGLGVLFTMAQWVPGWHVGGASLLAILFGAMAASWFVRRLGYMGGMSYQGPMLHMMRGPMILAVLAVLFLLQGVHAATIGQTWPVILLVLGAVLLGERMGLGTDAYSAAYHAQSTSVVPTTEAATTPSAESNNSEQQISEQRISEHNDERDGYTR